METLKSSFADSVYYFLDLQRLRPGDIVLTRSPGELVSELIRAVTQSDYSHAFLVLNNADFVESSDYGVVKCRIDRFAVRDPTHIKVMRLKDAARQQAQIDAAVKYVSRFITAEYADWDVLTTLFSIIPRFEHGKYFCSQLVCEAFSQTGITLVTGRSPEKISPGMLADTEQLEDISDVLIRRNSQECSFVPSLLDRHNAISPVEEESTVKQRVFQKLRPTLTKHALNAENFNQALIALANLWKASDKNATELDEVFSRLLIELGFTKLPSKLYPSHCDSFFLDFYILRGIKSQVINGNMQRQLLAFYQMELERLRITIQERDQDVTLAKQTYIVTGLETIRLHLAATWEAFRCAKRIEKVLERCIQILEAALRENSS